MIRTSRRKILAKIRNIPVCETVNHGKKRIKMQQVKSITIVLENCEEITISQEHIGSFYCKDITTSIARTACNSITKEQYCKEFYLEIHKNADRYYSFWGIESDKTVFKRLAYPDITGISITYEDDTAEYCIMPWKDADRTRCNNAYQTSYVSKSGNMHICICRDKSIEDMADFDSVDNLE